MQPMRHSRPPLLAAAIACWVLVGCSGPAERFGDAFWLRAAPPTKARLEPPPAPGAPGVVTRHAVLGVVRAHVRRPAGGPPSELLLQRLDGERQTLFYEIGAGRWLPLEPGDPVRVHLLVRRHVEDDGEDVGLSVWLRAPAAAENQALDRLVAAVEQRRVLDDEGIPAVLRSIAPTTMAVYHTAGRFGVECDETHQHSWFRFGRAAWLRGVQGARHPLDPRLVAPGSRVEVADGTDRFDVLLIDNRTTARSACRVPSEPAWSWAAIAIPLDQRREEPPAKR